MNLGSRRSPLHFLDHWHLRTKLVLSHLLAALGSLVLLTVVVIVAVQDNFNQTQNTLFHNRAAYVAQQYENTYASDDSWNSLRPLGPLLQRSINLQLLAIMDQNQHFLTLQVPNYLSVSRTEGEQMTHCMVDALNGAQPDGHMHDPSESTNFSGPYICMPLKDTNGNIVGSMFYAEPETYPHGLSVNNFIVNISRDVLIISAIIALIIILCSLVFAQKLARPLVILQRGVDRISAGDYTERITLPERGDEVGQLIHSFNRMAAQIETNIEELQRQERIRRELTANIAHDLYTPLATIQGFSEALADGVIMDEPARIDTYQTIVHEVQRMERLVKKVQQLSSLETGQIHLDLAPLNIAELIAGTLEMVGSEYEKAGITLRQQLQSDSLVLADSDSVVQIVLNLLDNAKRYTPTGGSITVGCRTEETMTRIWIQDTGSGIDAHDLTRIFDRFYRSDPSRTQATGGSGLGLAIVKALVERHGGTIWAESTPGQGTLMTFTLRNAQTDTIAKTHYGSDGNKEVPTI